MRLILLVCVLASALLGQKGEFEGVSMRPAQLPIA
jgi:hypothetical protein